MLWRQFWAAVGLVRGLPWGLGRGLPWGLARCVFWGWNGGDKRLSISFDDDNGLLIGFDDEAF